jgi:hypothetical protein
VIIEDKTVTRQDIISAGEKTVARCDTALATASAHHSRRGVVVVDHYR